MKIPVGDFGFQAPGSYVRPDIPLGPQPGAALSEIGATGQKISRELGQEEALQAHQQYTEAHRQRLESEQLAREAKRAEAMTIHARAQNALADAHDQLVNGITDGSVSVDEAPKIWQDASAKIVDEHLKTVDKSNVELVRAGLEGNIGSFGRSVNQAIVTKNRQDIGAKLYDYIEQMQRFGMSDPEGAKKQGAMAIDAQGPLAGYNAEQVAKLRQNFVEGVTFNAANNRLVQIKNDRGALDAFMQSIGDMPDLDPGKKNILINQANSAIVHLDNKALAAENRRLTQLQRTGLQLETRIAMGIPVQPGEFDAYLSAAKGTQFEDTAKGLLEEQRTVTDLLKKTPAEQAAYVSQLEQNLMTKGEGNPKIVARLKQTVGNTVKMLGENPLQYAMDRGGAVVQPLDMANPDAWQDNLANRTQVLLSQQKQVGGGLGALMPQEAAQLAHTLQDGTPAQKVAVLEPLRRGLGDDRVFRATMQQVAKDSPATALAAMISTRENPLVVPGVFTSSSYQPGDVSAQILKGEHLLNPTKADKAQDGKGRGFPMPKGPDEKAMDQRFADAVGEVFAGAPDAYRTQLQAARDFYAATLSDKGDYSGELDSRSWARSIEATLPVAKFNGSAVAVPWGMDEATFKNRVANAFPQALKAAGLPAEMSQAAGRYTLQNLTGTKYLVRQGTDYLTGPKGRVVLEVPDLPSAYQSPAERARRYVPQ
jgi:hypothetical protein